MEFFANLAQFWKIAMVGVSRADSQKIFLAFIPKLHPSKIGMNGLLKPLFFHI